MALKLTCPHCGHKNPLSEPLPLSGTTLPCAACQRGLAVDWPPGMVEKLQAAGKVFVHRAEPPAEPTPPDRGDVLADGTIDAPPPVDRERAAVPQLKKRAPINLPCLQCGARVPLDSPLPLPGDSVQCTTCGSKLLVSYPPGAVEKLHARGFVFRDGEALVSTVQIGDLERRLPGPVDDDDRPPPPRAMAPAEPTASERPTEIDRSPLAEVEPTLRVVQAAPKSAADARPRDGRTEGEKLLAAFSQRTEMAVPGSAPDSVRLPGPALLGVAGDEPTRSDTPTKVAPKKPGFLRRWTKRLGGVGCLAVLVLGCAGGGTGLAGYFYLASTLPSVEALQSYEPATVTVVRARDGQVIGEIYEERRYVVPLEQIPKHVQDAFVAAEDGNFWTHWGVDYLGMVKAFGRMATGGQVQGASTITQQVARNFLLTRDRNVVRKAKEIILSHRIEGAYSKERILYLYLNEIFFGNQAYGVEAASRVYFDKPIGDVTLAEAAILAGLPPAPSSYNPIKSWKLAKQRQTYVLGQMLDKGYITRAEHDAALAEDVVIHVPQNKFRELAPHFTEHIRRYLVDKYGEQRVLHEGLDVTTTVDLALQQLARDAVTKGVYDVDDRVGFRRHQLVTLPDEAAIATKRQEEEQAMLRDWLRDHDPAGGRTPPPAKSELVVGEHYEGVVLDVSKTWALVGVGAHTGVVPLAWSDRLAVTNPPDRGGGYRTRIVRDYGEKVDVDADPETPDVPMLRTGDVISVEVRAASTQDPKVAKAFTGTPGAAEGQAALALWQVNAVEGALFSYDLSTGAVRALVGGVDFGQSQFNRAIQAYRQVGSTFKPLVYSAAVESKKVTTASLVADAPLAFATNDDFVWKPDNFGGDYEGDMTLRKALMKSKNTCTIRVMESVDPTFTEDIVYNFAKKLGIAGPPMPGSLPDELRTLRGGRDLCPWIKEQPEFRVCMDRYPPLPEGLSDRQHRAEMKPDEVWWCRACDLSLALGSASLTMEELVRAYSAFPTGGRLVQPYYVEKVADRAGNVLEEHQAVEFQQVLDPGVAAIGTWLLQSVVWGGTGARAGQLGVQLGGKTGTTNDSKDTWFVGFSPNVATGVWVGFDDPGTLGGMATGSSTALPIWIDYMAVAAPKKDDRPFPMDGIEWANIDERTGKRVTNGGVRYPFLPGTVPESTGFAAGQVDTSDPTEL